MMFYGLRGLGGLGLSSGLGWTDSDPCGSIPLNDPYRSPPNYCTQPSGNVTMFNTDGSVPPDPFSTTPDAPSSAQQTAWWQSALTSLTSGVVKGLVAPTPGSPTAILPTIKPPTPWYKTPLGIVGIVGAIGGAAYFLSK
jgi:hypothetical protein